MPGGALQVDSSGRLTVSTGGNLVVGGAGDPCCCGAGCTNVCFIPWRYTYDCAGHTWSGGTAGGSICDNRISGTSNAKVGGWQYAGYCTYQTYVRSTNCCDVTGCGTNTGTAPGHPPGTPPCNCGGALGHCAECPSTITVIAVGSDGYGFHCNLCSGTYDCTNSASCVWTVTQGVAPEGSSCTVRCGQGITGNCLAGIDDGNCPHNNVGGTQISVGGGQFDTPGDNTTPFNSCGIVASSPTVECDGCPSLGPYYSEECPCVGGDLSCHIAITVIR